MQPRKKTETENDRGFTLPELLIVMVLLGILAAIAIPSFFSFIDSRNAASAANQITADLRLSHGTARNRLSNIQVTFNTTSNCYNVAGNGISRNRCLPEGTKFISSITAVEFKADGSAVVSGSGDIGVARASRSTPEYRLRLNTQTSRIEVV
ncbi:pilus assembly FimT family protein [Rubrobacter indicoceani]|uniref:pilus assembly FimT family protein n=1 Tax=Rubrobacter indicoceani TaxID=2051957 RepID=UPI000E5AB917|nr:prepilin-type N-terminal cleavage/methylation domain-containing protein [Rubrobacter indicoceani]